MNVTLTPELEAFVLSQVQSGVFASADDVIRTALVRMRDDHSGPDEEYDPELERMLLEGLDSGDPKPMTKVDWDNIRKHLEDYIARK